jgi:hypothetical protein
MGEGGRPKSIILTGLTVWTGYFLPFRPALSPVKGMKGKNNCPGNKYPKYPVNPV